MAEQVRKDVAVFIDFENIYVSVRDKLDTNPNFEIIMDRCNELGRVILARAYADWYRYPRITSALYANNIEPMYVPTYYYDKDAGRTGRPIKNSVDMNLCIEAMRTLFTMPGLSTFVLITGDRDFIPLVNSIRQQGKDVIIIGVGGAASSHLAQSADEFIFYEHLIGKQIATGANTPTNRRYSEIDEFERPARDRATPVVQRASRHDTSKPEKVDRKEKEPTGLTEDAIWEMLAKAVVEARARSIVPSVGSLKTLVRELSNGEFRESMVRDASGRPLERFRDVVHEAAKRGKLIISTDSIVNEIFLPGEDPRTLSSFNVPMEKPPERAEEPLPSVPAANEAKATTNQTTGDKTSDKSRRRRRNERDNKRLQTPVAVVESDMPTVDEYVLVSPESVLVVAPPPAAEQPPTVDAPVQPNGVPFSDEERQMVRDIVANSERALSFQQIYDALRSTRNRGGEQQTPRTNEELRSLVKSIINAGELQRIGRGNRVSYRMAQPKTTKPTATVPAEDVVELLVVDALEAVDVVVIESVAEVVDSVVETSAPMMVPTPDDLSDIDDGLSLPPLTPTNVTVPDATPPAPAKSAKPKKSPRTAPKSSSGRSTKKSTQDAASEITTPPAPAKPAKTTTTRESKSQEPKKRSSKAKSTQKIAKSTAAETAPVVPQSAVQGVPSPADVSSAPSKPRRRKQTPES